MGSPKRAALAVAGSLMALLLLAFARRMPLRPARVVVVARGEAGPANGRTVAVVGNDTAAANRFAVYAQVPKTGSTTLEHMVRDVSKANDAHWNVSPVFRYMVGDKAKQRQLATRALLTGFPLATDSSRADAIPGHDYANLGFTAHVRFLDFRDFGVDNPIWVSQVRDPVERFISWFFYIRRQDGIFNRKVKKLGLAAAKRWRAKNITHCILDKDDKECNPVPMKSSYEPSPITYLCGYHSDCEVHGSRWAADRARANAEEFFQVVGVLGRFGETLQVLEATAPNFFAGISSTAERHMMAAPEEGLASSSSAVRVPESARAALKRTFALEQELFEFLDQRLVQQHQRLVSGKTKY